LTEEEPRIGTRIGSSTERGTRPKTRKSPTGRRRSGTRGDAEGTQEWGAKKNQRRKPHRGADPSPLRKKKSAAQAERPGFPRLPWLSFEVLVGASRPAPLMATYPVYVLHPDHAANPIIGKRFSGGQGRPVTFRRERSRGSGATRSGSLGTWRARGKDHGRPWPHGPRPPSESVSQFAAAVRESPEMPRRPQ